MAWIEAHEGLPDHPKTIAAAHVLKIDKDALVGKLLRLWTWALDNRPTGYIPEHDIETIAEKMRWAKKPQILMDGLCVAPDGYSGGFLDRIDGGYVIHDWESYTKTYYAREEARDKDRKRKQKERERQQDIQENSDGNPTDVLRNSSGQNPDETRNSISYRNLYRNLIDDDDNTRARDGKTEAACFQEFATLIGNLSQRAADELISFLNDGVEDAMICEVIRAAHDNGGKNLNYVRAALQGELEDGVKTLDAYKAKQERRRSGKSERGQPVAATREIIWDR